MSDVVWAAIIGAVPGIGGLVAAIIAARRSGQAKDQSAAAERASTAAAQNAATAVTNTAPISNGFANHVQDELARISNMLVNHINNREIHGR
jgi:hydroxyethylthiazole kinase-like sugar kinase family protein